MRVHEVMRCGHVQEWPPAQRIWVMLQVAQGGRLKEPRGSGVATYRAGQTARRSLVLWVVFKQSVTELCYSVVTALLLCGDRYM